MKGGHETLLHERYTSDGHWASHALTFLHEFFGPVLPAETVKVYSEPHYAQREYLGQLYCGVATAADGNQFLVATGEPRPDFQVKYPVITLQGEHSADIFKRWEVSLAPRPIPGYGLCTFSQPRYDPMSNTTSIHLWQSNNSD